MSELKDCYNKIREVLGVDTEPIESVELVEEYRQYWKPDKVQTILLAESHVYTDSEDRSIVLPEIVGLPQPKYPRQYARFVYCLAYGESDFTRKPLARKSLRYGTPHFWKLFYSCCNRVSRPETFAPILKEKTCFEERLSNKLQLLKSLKQRGIWLVDASVVALYKNDKNTDRQKPKARMMKKVIGTSWEYFTKGVVKEAKPEKIVCIGKGVWHFLEEDLRSMGYLGDRVQVIPQPNARGNKDYFTHYNTLYEACRSS